MRIKQKVFLKRVSIFRHLSKFSNYYMYIIFFDRSFCLFTVLTAHWEPRPNSNTNYLFVLLLGKQYDIY